MQTAIQPYAEYSSVIVSIHFFNRAIGTEIEGNFESYFDLQTKAQVTPVIVIHLSLLSI